MMRFEVDGTHYKAAFFYDKVRSGSRRGQRQTFCAIMSYKPGPKDGKDEQERMVAEGSTICSKTDNYSKAKGKKLAWGRAVKHLAVCHAMREQQAMSEKLWDHYREQVGFKKEMVAV